MDQATYDGYSAQIKNGEMVVIGGRSALTIDQLLFAVKASGDTLPTGLSAPDESLPAVLADDLEAKELTDLQALAASLGLTVDESWAKESLIGAIRDVHLSLQGKP